MLGSLGIEREAPLQSDESVGSLFERLVRDDVARHLREQRTDQQWDVRTDATGLSEFSQYEHLADLARLVREDDSRTLATALGQDYEVTPDVTVGIIDPRRLAKPYLHATISCKFTLRSDRAQNAKTESAVLTRHRKGRMPHVVGVTAEPLPTRIASLAQGTGDLDVVFHVAIDALQSAVDAEGTSEQKAKLELLRGARRLLDYDELLRIVAL